MNILNLLNINFILNFIIFIAFTSISLIFLQKILHYKSTIEKNLLFIFINAIVFVLGNLLFTPGITCTLLIISSILSLCFLLKIAVFNDGVIKCLLFIKNLYRSSFCLC